MKHQITITFNREKDTHLLEVEECNGKEMLLAYQSLRRSIEEKIGIPVDMALDIYTAKQGEEDETSR
jgi:hypothetical protein